MNEQELLQRALALSQSVVHDVLSPMAAARQIWVMTSENPDVPWQPYEGFISAAAQWEGSTHQDDLANDARHAAEQLLLDYEAGVDSNQKE